MKAMFKKRLLKLADIIENNKPVTYKRKPVKFNMAIWNREETCGTAACIAGHAAILSGEEFNPDAWDTDSDSPAQIGADWLGLKDWDQSMQLFIPTEHGYRGVLENITRRRAATVLRHFAETGEIKWNMKLS